MKISRRQSIRLAAAGLPSLARATRRSPLPPIRLIVLDIGGTLIEERGDVPQALRDALAHHGVDSTPEEIAKRRGGSKREIIRYFVEAQSLPPATDRVQLTATIFDEFTANIVALYRSVPPIGGAEDAIKELRRRNYLVATTTGFDRVIAQSIFTRLGWNQYFTASICSDDVAQGRPSPFMLFHAMEASLVNSVAEVVAVGDTPLDLRAGTNAGLRAVVGVLSGAGTAAQLHAEPHTHILPSVKDLPALLAAKL